MDIGKAIRIALADKNLAKTEVAQAMGSNSASMTKWTSDDANPTIKQLIKLCKVLDMKLSELIALGEN